MQATEGPAVAWSDSEHMLAMAVDLLAAANWQRSDPKKHPDRPAPLPRPGDAEKKQRMADELAARLIAQRQRIGR